MSCVYIHFLPGNLVPLGQSFGMADGLEIHWYKLSHKDFPGAGLVVDLHDFLRVSAQGTSD